MISTVICMSLRGFWHLCNLPYVYALFWLISIARYFFKSPSICFRESKYGFYCEHHVAYFHSILWHQVRLWLELFASTVGRYLSQISQVCWLFWMWYMPLFGLVQARPWFPSSTWISSVAGFLKYSIHCVHLKLQAQLVHMWECKTFCCLALTSRGV